MLLSPDPREELRRLIRRHGCVTSTPDHPLRSRSGRTLPWMFYGWGFSLTERGATLAGHCLLHRLASFSSTQVASHGYSSLPLVTACVLLGGGRYSGLAVRDQRKAHGAGRLVEGPGDRARPVVVVDDCLSTGTSFFKAVKALEEEGYAVEGLACLLEFPGQGGREWAESLGFRVESVFDPTREELFDYPRYVPPHLAIRPVWRRSRLPDGLHPAQVARQTALAWLEDGTVPLPPARFDAARTAPGGVYVSVRDRATGRKVARSGLWHFHAADADAPRDVVLATVRALEGAAEPLTPTRLAGSRIAVSLLGPQEAVTPGGLDLMRYGVVARCLAQPWKVGGALPNTEFFCSEVEQYRHALGQGRIPAYVAHELYRHTVTRLPEPGEPWPSAGATAAPEPWAHDPCVGAAFLRRARAVLAAAAAGAPPPSGGALDDALVPVPLWGVAVSLYAAGRLAGCRVAWSGTLDQCVVRAAEGAWNDPRRASGGEGARGLDDARVVVTLLHDRRCPGRATPARAASMLRPGLDTVAVWGEGKGAVLLAHVLTQFGWSAARFCARALGKSGVPEARARWATYSCASWAETPRGAVPLRFGFPARGAQPPAPRDDAAALGEYLLRQIGRDGLPAYAYDPVRDASTPRGTAGRAILALAALDAAGRALRRADFRAAAAAGLDHCLEHLRMDGPAPRLALPDWRNGFAAETVLLWALAASGAAGAGGRPRPAARALARHVAARLHPDGVFSTSAPGRRLGIDHDLLSGTALLALARYEAASGERVLPDLAPALDWYRARFRAGRPWGMVHWHLQAWSAAHALRGGPEPAAFVFELADWAASRQLASSGAFLSTLAPRGPSFHTACVLEGMADAWALAACAGDGVRAGTYARSVRAGLAFMDHLVVRDEDTFCMPRGPGAAGGVRESLLSSTVRIDYVAHHLLALSKLTANAAYCRAGPDGPDIPPRTTRGYR